MKVWNITVPTFGYIVYEVKAKTEEEAIQIVKDDDGMSVS